MTWLSVLGTTFNTSDSFTLFISTITAISVVSSLSEVVLPRGTSGIDVKIFHEVGFFSGLVSLIVGVLSLISVVGTLLRGSFTFYKYVRTNRKNAEIHRRLLKGGAYSVDYGHRHAHDEHDRKMSDGDKDRVRRWNNPSTKVVVMMAVNLICNYISGQSSFSLPEDWNRVEDYSAHPGILREAADISGENLVLADAFHTRWIPHLVNEVFVSVIAVEDGVKGNRTYDDILNSNTTAVVPEIYYTMLVPWYNSETRSRLVLRSALTRYPTDDDIKEVPQAIVSKVLYDSSLGAFDTAYDIVLHPLSSAMSLFEYVVSSYAYAASQKINLTSPRAIVDVAFNRLFLGATEQEQNDGVVRLMLGMMFSGPVLSTFCSVFFRYVLWNSSVLKRILDVLIRGVGAVEDGVSAMSGVTVDAYNAAMARVRDLLSGVQTVSVKDVLDAMIPTMFRRGLQDKSEDKSEDNSEDDSEDDSLDNSLDSSEKVSDLRRFMTRKVPEDTYRFMRDWVPVDVPGEFIVYKEDGKVTVPLRVSPLNVVDSSRCSVYSVDVLKGDNLSSKDKMYRSMLPRVHSTHVNGVEYYKVTFNQKIEIFTTPELQLCIDVAFNNGENLVSGKRAKSIKSAFSIGDKIDVSGVGSKDDILKAFSDEAIVGKLWPIAMARRGVLLERDAFSGVNIPKRFAFNSAYDPNHHSRVTTPVPIERIGDFSKVKQLRPRFFFVDSGVVYLVPWQGWSTKNAASAILQYFDPSKTGTGWGYIQRGAVFSEFGAKVFDVEDLSHNVRRRGGFNTSVGASIEYSDNEEGEGEGEEKEESLVTKVEHYAQSVHRPLYVLNLSDSQSILHYFDSIIETF